MTHAQREAAQTGDHNSVSIASGSVEALAMGAIRAKPARGRGTSRVPAPSYSRIK